MTLTKNDLQAIAQVVDERLEERLEEKLEPIHDKMSELNQKLDTTISFF